MPRDYNDLLKTQNNFTKPEKNDSMEVKTERAQKTQNTVHNIPKPLNTARKNSIGLIGANTVGPSKIQTAARNTFNSLIRAQKSIADSYNSNKNRGIMNTKPDLPKPQTKLSETQKANIESAYNAKKSGIISEKQYLDNLQKNGVTDVKLDLSSSQKKLPSEKLEVERLQRVAERE